MHGSGNDTSFSIDSTVVTSPSGDLNDNDNENEKENENENVTEQSISDLYGTGGVTNYSTSASVSVSFSGASARIQKHERRDSKPNENGYGNGNRGGDDKIKSKEIELYERELDIENDGQLFAFKKSVNSEYYRIYCVKQGDMVLDVEHQSLDIGAPIIEYKKKSNGCNNQLFKLSIYKDNRYDNKYRQNWKHNIQFMIQNENVKNENMTQTSNTAKRMKKGQSAV